MTIPYYGKRDPGGLTAASPGDTLYFAFGSYNDSGDSEALTGLAVSDIEVAKNGGATARATDSGYSLISDTGQFGDRVGLYRFSVQLFNTADDTGFYDAGSWYQVAVDAVTIDGKTVRFWAGSFEIGTPRANLVEVAGDTGQAVHLGQLADEYDTGQIAADASVSSFGDTGVNDRLAKILADTDTGLKTGLSVNVDQIDGDTGHADRLGKFAGVLSANGQVDTGTLAGTQAGTIDANVTYVNETAVGGTGDTGAGDPWGPT